LGAEVVSEDRSPGIAARGGGKYLQGFTTDQEL